MVADIEWGLSASAPPGPGAAGGANPLGRPDAPEADELLEVGRSRPTRRWLQRLEDRARRVPLVLRCILASVVVLAVVIAYSASRPARHRPVPPVAAATANVGGAAPSDWDLSMILAKAHQPGPLVGYVRSDSTRGACPLVPIGRSPQRSITAALRTELPDYTVRDVAPTLNEFTAMCAIDLRAASAHGSILVVEVVAPQHGAGTHAFTALSVGFRSDGTTTVSMAAAVTRDGWSITAGAVAPNSDQPSSAALLRLADDPTLLW